MAEAPLAFCVSYLDTLGRYFIATVFQANTLFKQEYTHLFLVSVSSEIVGRGLETKCYRLEEKAR